MSLMSDLISYHSLRFKERDSANGPDAQIAPDSQTYDNQIY